MSKITTNKFSPQKTKRVLIHNGKFHADDIMFAALAIVCGEQCNNHIEVQRVKEVLDIEDEQTIAGDIGYGIYDHHTHLDNTPSLGSQNDSDTFKASSCGLLYREIQDFLFKNQSETKKYFEALIDIIEHCDNSPNNNTFSDSINCFYPTNPSRMDEMAMKAISYCKSIIYGFLHAHNKEVQGKIWATPRIHSSIYPGDPSKIETRYRNQATSIRKRYQYVSFNNEREIMLHSLDTYSLVCGAINQKTRQYWQGEIARLDSEQNKEIERREKEELPIAIKNMQYRTLVLNNYIPLGQITKQSSATSIVLPSSRGEYQVKPLKSNMGQYRVNPSMLSKMEGCTYVGNDDRFYSFSTQEQAINAAYELGREANKLIAQYGFHAYRVMFGGIQKEYSNDFFQDLSNEDIALNFYIKENIKDPSHLTAHDYNQIRMCVIDNPYLIHCFCSHFQTNDGGMRWDFNAQVLEGITSKEQLRHTIMERPWNMGLKNFIKSNEGQVLYHQVYPFLK